MSKFESEINGIKLLSIEEYYTVDLVRQNPNWLFLFGDNTFRQGKGGQAIIRDEPNTFGITTKVAPTTTPQSYFFDEHEILFRKWTINYQMDFLHCMVVLDEIPKYKTIVFPRNGFGRGLAALDKTSPKCYKILCDSLKEYFGFDNNTGEFI